MASIALRKLSKTFGGRAVISGIDLDIDDGELIVFVGPSGCGKSTLLRLIAGLEDVTGGQLFIGGKDMTRLPPARRELSMVFQSYALYPHMSVRDNIAFPLKMAGEDETERARKVGGAARMLNLEEVLDRKPRTLSGGQRQRVAIGRAIVREPKAFLFDEPLSNLDAALRVSMRMEIAALHRRLGATMIYVTHDQVEAMTLADRIVVLNHGTIEQIGTPLELYHEPATRFVGGFIGSPSMNFLHGARASPYGAASVGIRPEHLVLTKTEGAWRGSVQLVEHLAVETFVHVQIDEHGSFTVRVPGECDVHPDEEVWLTPDARYVHRFDSNGLAMAKRNQG